MMRQIRISFGAAGAALIVGCGAAGTVDGKSASTRQVEERRMQFKDGTYTADGLYGGLPSRLTVTVQLASGVIRQVRVRTHATDPTSLEFQRAFAAAVPAVVVGKPIADVKVGKLAGASGCPDGFNAAISRIRDQASR